MNLSLIVLLAFPVLLLAANSMTNFPLPLSPVGATYLETICINTAGTNNSILATTVTTLTISAVWATIIIEDIDPGGITDLINYVDVIVRENASYGVGVQWDILTIGTHNLIAFAVSSTKVPTLLADKQTTPFIVFVASYSDFC